jgi:C_GCAxxG_C_C family probable redox protein
MSKSEDAAAIMKAHRVNCAQSVISVFCDELDVDLNTALRIAMAFGGGMARAGNTCGAVTGAYMALGLGQTISAENPRDSIDKTYQLVHEFNDKFKTMHGSLVCKELLGCDVSMSDGLAQARDQQLFALICPNLVHNSVQIVESLLQSK